MTRERKSILRGNHEVGLTAESRIGSNIKPSPSGCWLWKGKHSDRYPTDYEVGLVHRFIYQTMIGPIPDGHHLHHECRNRSCVNPAHLQPLTPSQHKLEHLRNG